MNVAMNEMQSALAEEMMLPGSSLTWPPRQEDAEWGNLARSAQAKGESKLAWQAFLKRRFFAPILRSPDDDPKNFMLHFVRRAPDRRPALMISEVRARLEDSRADGLMPMSGVDLLLRLDGLGAIDVLLDDGVFQISRKRAEWLRSGIEMTKARVVVRNLLQSAAPGGPFPVLRLPSSTQTTHVTKAAPVQQLGEALASVRDGRYFVPVTLSAAAIGMMFVLGEARVTDASVAQPAPVAAVAATMQAVMPRAQVQMPQVAAAPVAQHVFAPWDNSFSVRLPGVAEEVELSPDEAAQMGGLPANYYRLELDGVTYEMSMIQYVEGVPADLTPEMDFRQKLLTGGGSTLLSARPLALGQATGREVRVRLPGGGERAARYAFNGEKFCMLMVTVPAGSAGAAHANAALASFQLH